MPKKRLGVLPRKLSARAGISVKEKIQAVKGAVPGTAAGILPVRRLVEVLEDIPPSRVIAVGVPSNLNLRTAAVPERTNTEADRTENRMTTPTPINRPATVVPIKVHMGAPRAVTSGRMTITVVANKPATVCRVPTIKAAGKPPMVDQTVTTLPMAANKVVTRDPATARLEALKVGKEDQTTPTGRRRAPVSAATACTEAPRVLADTTTNLTKVLRVVSGDRTIPMGTTEAVVDNLRIDRTKAVMRDRTMSPTEAHKLALVYPKPDCTEAPRVAMDNLIVSAEDPMIPTTNAKVPMGAVPPAVAGQAKPPTEAVREVMGDLIISMTLALMADGRSSGAVPEAPEILAPGGTMVKNLTTLAALVRGIALRTNRHRRGIIHLATLTPLAARVPPKITAGATRQEPVTTSRGATKPAAACTAAEVLMKVTVRRITNINTAVTMARPMMLGS